MADEKKTRRPVTLYIQQVDFSPSWGVLGEDIYGDIDLEFDREHAENVIRNLQRELNKKDFEFVRVRAAD